MTAKKNYALYRHINVRFVTVFAFSCALAAGGWVAWRLSRDAPIILDAHAPHRGSRPQAESRQRVSPEPDWQGNPFSSTYRTARIQAEVQRAQEKKKQEEARRARLAEEAKRRNLAKLPKAPPSPKPRPPTAKPPKPKPPALRLTYRGMLSRPDGDLIAIIEHHDGRTLSVRQHDKLAGHPVTAITRTALTLGAVGDKPGHSLPVGKATQVVPPTPKGGGNAQRP